MNVEYHKLNNTNNTNNNIAPQNDFKRQNKPSQTNSK